MSESSEHTAEKDALAGKVLDAVVEVLTDRTYDEHAADASIWQETVDHLRLAISRVIPPGKPAPAGAAATDERGGQ